MEKDKIVDEDFIRQDIGFQKILMLHLNRLSELSTRIKEPGIAPSFHFAVMTLENFLFPYHDQKYKDSREALLSTRRAEPKGEKEGRKFIDKILTWSSVEGSGEFKYIGLALAMLQILQELMARKGLLLETEGSGKVENE